MHRPMEGVRVLEVAQFTFVPAAGAVLADWGADVIKVEHAQTGDAQRGLSRVMGLQMGDSSFAPIMEGPNRGKRSIGLALEVPEARAVFEELVRASDVFVTNFLPEARAKLGLEVGDIRAINPDIIYVRGTGFGVRGPEADKGGYDATAFWARGGSAAGVMPPGTDRMTNMPAGAYGDSLGGMTIAGGIAAALFARAQTGEPSVVDVSLLGVGAWSTQLMTNMTMMLGMPFPKVEPPRYGQRGNPLIGGYRTRDDRWIMLSMLQPGRYWAEFCEAVGRPDLITDARFAEVPDLMANSQEAGEIIAGIIAERDLADWIGVFDKVEGQWAAVQDAWDVGQDVSLRANGLIAQVVDAEGVTRELIANPVQFDETPVQLTRAPQFAEHTDEILRELGRDDEALIALKIAGAVT